MADGMTAKFMSNAFVGWTMSHGQYYPPDFDMTKLTPMKHLKKKGPQEQLINIRMMMPFTMVCDACGDYNYTGTKFSSKCERIRGESYLGLSVYRFYGRCKHCFAEFTFKTDPKYSDYSMESGGKRSYEAWKDADMAETNLKTEKEKAEEDAMMALERKSIDVQAEMQALEDLDSIRSLNKRLGAREDTIEGALEFLFHKHEQVAKQEIQLVEGETKELEGFREAQEELRRNKLEEEVDGIEAMSSTQAGSGASSGGAESSIEKVFAAATKERVDEKAPARPTVGAKFVVKRKGPPLAEEDAGGPKRPKNGQEATASAASAGSGAGLGVFGLGDYDSEESA